MPQTVVGDVRDARLFSGVGKHMMDLPRPFPVPTGEKGFRRVRSSTLAELLLQNLDCDLVEADNLSPSNLEHEPGGFLVRSTSPTLAL